MAPGITEHMQPPASGSSWYERRPFFSDDTVLQLSEHLQPSELLYAMSSGCTLSLLHANGIVHGDLHGNNTLFDAWSGVAGFVDVEEHQTPELSVERMATDFLVPLASMGFPWCQALLSGYIKIARLSIDPKHPGYCDDLLDALGGSVESDPRPRSATLPPETLDESLAWLDSDLQANGDAAAFWATPTTATQCAYILGGLIAAGVDCSVLTASPSVEARTPNHAAIRDMLASAHHEQTVGTCPQEVAPAGWEFVARSLAAKAAQPGQGDGTRVKPDTRIFRTIAELRESHTQEDLEETLCALTEVCDWLAARADGGISHFPKDVSIQTAQVSYMLLQLVAEPALSESAELAVARRHALLSWYPALIEHRGQVDDRDLLYLFAYSNTRVSAYRHMFQGPGRSEDRRRVWTATWRASGMARDWLRRLLVRRLASGQPPFEEASLLDQSISLAANNLGALLSDYAQQVLLALAVDFMSMSDEQRQRGGFNDLPEELDVLIKLLNVTRSRDPGSALTSDYRKSGAQYLKCLKLGASHLKSSSLLATLPFDDEIAR
jgi:hypothetical protein